MHAVPLFTRVHTSRYEFFNYSPLLNGHMRFETEFEWGGTRVVVTTCEVENLRVRPGALPLS